MGALTHEDFAAFFHALWGGDPFPWQSDLLQRLATGKDPRRNHNDAPGRWPDVLDLPTGSGKTAAIDIAVFHLALEATKRSERLAPLRIAFVVDRRLIVDDAYERTGNLAATLQKALDAPDIAAPVILKVAQALCRFAGPGQPPLVAHRLRGGAPLEDDWARTPAQPTVLCSTVDQLGSRLLFRGYGVADRMKPIHAGLVGSDCLILLDEAHLSEPFRQTLEAIKALRAPDSAPFGFSILTATPNVGTKPPFGLGTNDLADRILSRRLSASKPARLIEIAGKQGIDSESRRAEAVADAAKAVVGSLKAGGVANPAVGVVLNRVVRARAVFDCLRDELKDAEVILVIGPARPVDRDKLTQQLAPIRTRQSDTPRQLERPLVIVATQTIEAGVDIDFDGLVTEAAALDALRQRFGRLDRAGRGIPAEATVLAHKDDIGAKADDAVYGDRIKTTWEALKRWSEGTPEGRVDFGILSMQATLDKEAGSVSDLLTRTENAPILMPAYVDLWSQTSPIPNADPEVALFLHGPDRSPASVQIVWRADIHRDDLVAGRDSHARLIELFSLVPPRAGEAIQVPLWAARAFLSEDRASFVDLSDVAERVSEESDRGIGRPVFRWAGRDSDRTRTIYPRDLNPGDLIVVPAEYGGCDEFGWEPSSKQPARDVADAALWPFRTKRFAVRVTPELIAQDFGNDGSNVADALLAKLAEHAEDRPTALLDAVLGPNLPVSLSERLIDLRNRRHGRLERVFAYGDDNDGRPRGVVFVAPRGLKRDADTEERAAAPATETDEIGLMSDQPIGLAEHCEDVRRRAAAFAVAAGLPPEVGADVALSGMLHDPGKADPRWQSYVTGGDPYGPDASQPLAKSGQRLLPPGAWERAGLPPYWRHEALSVRLAAIHPDFLDHAHDAELVLWLIGTHHGYGRPLFAHADEKDAETRSGLLTAFGLTNNLVPGPGPQSLAFDFKGRDWVQMFEALKARYGVWGLARLETFVRLADHRASEAPGSDAAELGKEATE